jgi:hypothetical protein
LGVAMGLSIRSETAMIPAHYHGAVGSLTLASMALWPYLLARRGEIVIRPLSRWFSGSYAAGMLMLMLGLAWAGVYGIARKQPHSALSSDGVFGLALMGAGGVLAIIAQVAFVVYAWSLCARGSETASGPGPHRPFRNLYRVMGNRNVRRGTVAALTAGSVVTLGALIAWLPAMYSPQGSPAVGAMALSDAQRAESDARFQQGVIMLHAKQYEHAVTAFHRVLQFAPKSPEAHVNMGFALLGMQRYEAARDFFESATVLRPGQVNAYYGLAEALEGLQDLRGALGAMRTYVHLAKPEDPYLRKAEAAVWEWEARLGGDDGKSRKPGDRLAPVTR